jgi:hypothetical protein
VVVAIPQYLLRFLIWHAPLQQWREHWYDACSQSFPDLGLEFKSLSGSQMNSQEQVSQGSYLSIW